MKKEKLTVDDITTKSSGHLDCDGCMFMKGKPCLLRTKTQLTLDRQLRGIYGDCDNFVYIPTKQKKTMSKEKTQELREQAIDNIKQVVKDVKYLIATDCNDETIQSRIENYISLLTHQWIPAEQVPEVNEEGRSKMYLCKIEDLSYEEMYEVLIYDCVYEWIDPYTEEKVETDDAIKVTHYQIITKPK